MAREGGREGERTGGMDATLVMAWWGGGKYKTRKENVPALLWRQ
mgnify:FL=1